MLGAIWCLSGGQESARLARHHSFSGILLLGLQQCFSLSWRNRGFSHDDVLFPFLSPTQTSSTFTSSSHPVHFLLPIHVN